MMPVAMLHGWLGSKEDWSQLSERLGNRPQMAIDLPEADSWSSGVEQVLEQLPQTCTLIGYSMGARLALGCAVASPERIRGLIFVSGNPGLTESERQTRRDHDRRVIEQLQTEPLDRFLRQWYRQPVFRSLTDDEFALMVQERIGVDRRRQVALMRAYSIAEQPDYWPCLTRIHTPVCVVVGEQDAKYVRILRQMVDQLPNQCSHVIAGVGHVVHRQKPHEFARIVHAFLDRIDERSDPLERVPVESE